MNADRVLASLVFPNLPGFAGGLFVRAKDKALALLCVQAYNDWIIDEWCAEAPGRFIPLAIFVLPARPLTFFSETRASHP